MKLRIGWIAFSLSTLVLAQRGSAGYVPQINAGSRAFVQHRYMSAAYYFRYALTWDPRGVAAHVGLGEVYLKIGKRDRALDEFSAALKIDPHSSEAERGIHEVRTEGQESQAFDDLVRLVQAEPNNADVLTTYSEELVERSRLEEAKTFADKALAIDPKQWHAYCALGRIAARGGDLATARRDLSLSIAHDPSDDDALTTLGELELEAKQYRAAVDWFRRLVRVLPEEREGHDKLAQALEASGDAAGAAKERAIVKEIEARTAGSNK